jgi:hypothetical protein
MEFDNALSLDSSVIPSTRPTQASYNKPDNWRERNRIGLEQLRDLVILSSTNYINTDKRFVLELRHNSIGHQLMMDNEEPE